MENRIEGNKLIAGFMEWAYEEIGGDTYLWTHKNGNRYTGGDSYSLSKNETIPYHQDWNWLMPVVEKIENLSRLFSVDIDRAECCVIEFKDNITETISNVSEETKIEAVWVAVIEFIKWYNTQNHSLLSQSQPESK